MDHYLLTNTNVYTGSGVHHNITIEIKGTKIKQLHKSEETIPTNLPHVNLQNKIIAPGFIDLQVNGGGGVLFNEDTTPSGIENILQAHKRFGTTSLLPTLITTSFEKMLLAISSVKELMAEKPYNILGLHLEGPYLNIDKKGVHEANYIRQIDEFELDELRKKGEGTIKVITLAPEKNDQEKIQSLLQAGIKVGAGHTNASYEEAIDFFSNGVEFVTHLFNAMSQFESRSPGVVGAAYEKGAFATIIADGYHVHYGAIKQSYKLLPKGRLLLVTDAMPSVGKENSNFRLGDYDILTTNGKCTTENGILAGSTLDMATAVRNCVNYVEIELEEALKMASTYVAEFLGLNDSLGYIKENYYANLVILNDELLVDGVIMNGKLEIFS